MLNRRLLWVSLGKCVAERPNRLLVADTHGTTCALQPEHVRAGQLQR